jgi:tripartite-type tricarboxylate transporter receptor subunit TctC
MSGRDVLMFVIAALCVLASRALAAEAGPPIRILVGLPAGSATDLAARALAGPLKDELGRPIIVENHPGAGGRIAAELLKRSPADGTTILIAPMGTTIILPVVFASVAYDPWKDFAHISRIATLRLVFAVAPETPARTLREYVDWARSDARKAAFGSAGTGTPPHLLGLMVSTAAGAELTHVPYKGGPPLVTDMAGGHIAAGVGTISDFAEQHRAGKLRVLAVGGSDRSTLLPGVPTFREAGYDIDGITWLGVHAPAGLPKAAVERLASALDAALRRGEVRQQFAKLGMEPEGTGPERFLQLMHEDRRKWEPVIRRFGIQEN